MYNLTAADFADTGQWRLLLNIYGDGMEAFLENTLHPDIELQKLCKVEWDPRNDSLCRNLEEAVYNNPRLLDDFATRIVVFDPRTLFIPKSLAEESAGSEEELYQKIYKASAKDVMFDSEGDITAVWCLAPGVKSFLMRTFPGARISCNLLEKIRTERKRLKDLGRDADTPETAEDGEMKVIKEVRDGEVDLILMKGTSLISASTHPYSSWEEIENLITNLKTAYRLTGSPLLIEE